MTRAPLAWIAPTAKAAVNTTVRLPGSKSMTARALILAAVADGPTTLRPPLRVRDTELLAAGLRSMGAHVSTMDDDRWVARPRPLIGPAHIDVGDAGTVMRFLPPLAVLADGAVTFDGDPRSRARPIGRCWPRCATLGARIDAAPSGSGGGLPIDRVRHRQPPRWRGHHRRLGVQPVGLRAAAGRPASTTAGVVVCHAGPPVARAPHLRMTVHMLRTAGAAVDDGTEDVWTVEPGQLHGRYWDIEPDLLAAAPFLAAALVTGGEVSVPGWPRITAQPGDHLRSLLAAMGGRALLTPDGLTVRGTGIIHGIDADMSEVSELTMVIAALAALADSPSTLCGLAHLRGGESDQLATLASLLSRLGTGVTALPDGLRIEPRPLRGATVDTSGDHRLAFAAAVIGLIVDGVELTDVACTSKTMPDFPARWRGMVEARI